VHHEMRRFVDEKKVLVFIHNGKVGGVEAQVDREGSLRLERGEFLRFSTDWTVQIIRSDRIICTIRSNNLPFTTNRTATLPSTQESAPITPESAAIP